MPTFWFFNKRVGRKYFIFIYKIKLQNYVLQNCDKQEYLLILHGVCLNGAVIMAWTKYDHGI